MSPDIFNKYPGTKTPKGHLTIRTLWARAERYGGGAHLFQMRSLQRQRLRLKEVGEALQVFHQRLASHCNCHQLFARHHNNRCTHHYNQKIEKSLVLGAGLNGGSPNNYSLLVRGLSELTREGEVPVRRLEWPVVSVSCPSGHMLKSFPDRPRHCSRHVHVTYVHLGMTWEVLINYSHKTGFCGRV